jgi:hypothetical protein
MASQILIRAKRFATRSDREREKLQSQIHTYAIRHNADSLERELASKRALGQEIEVVPVDVPTQIGFCRMESFVEWAIALVDAKLGAALA